MKVAVVVVGAMGGGAECEGEVEGRRGRRGGGEELDEGGGGGLVCEGEGVIGGGADGDFGGVTGWEC